MDKNIVVELFLISFDGVDIVLYSSKVEYNETLKKTVSEYLEGISSQEMKTFIFNAQEDEESLTLKYYGFLDYEEVLESKAHLFVPMSKHKQSKEITHLYTLIQEKIKELDPQVLRSFVGEFFTIDDIHYLFEIVTDTKTDKGNFHKMIKRKMWIQETDKLLENVSYRPPRLYTFK